MSPRRALTCAALFAAACFLAATALAWSERHTLQDLARSVAHRASGKATVRQRVRQHGPRARKRLLPWLKRAGVSWPPARVTLVALKQERELRLYAADADQPLRFVRSYPIRRQGRLTGPQLREGDRRTPEGIYRVDFLNPNSTNHLSMRIDYPNAADRAQAELDGRTRLGGEIYIHGKTTSIGCVAMGDRVIEELFVLAAEVGREAITVIISPSDMTRGPPPRWARRQPEWVQARYGRIREALEGLPEVGATR